MPKKKDGHGILDAIFNVGNQPEGPLAGRSSPGKPPAPAKKRPWISAKEECPNCGTLFPSGGVCPGCGLHDEDMPWHRA